MGSSDRAKANRPARTKIWCRHHGSDFTAGFQFLSFGKLDLYLGPALDLVDSVLLERADSRWITPILVDFSKTSQTQT